MTFAAIVFFLGCLFFGSAMFYLGSVMRKLIKVSGGYSARKLVLYRRGLNRLASELREPANVGDHTALTALDTISGIEDEVSDLEVEFEDRAKKAAGAK